MPKVKRMVISTLSGILFGFVCLGLASSSSGDLPWPVAVQIVLSRSLIGVCIGISTLSILHWSIHGPLIGLLFSLPLTFSGLMAPDFPGSSKISIFISTIVLGMIYGLLIELITSLLFKSRIEG